MPMNISMLQGSETLLSKVILARNQSNG